ncbi:MAG: nitrogen fixation negative regulator NifL [Zoogloeaceae bacterium]|jgi:nitrogen fixation negative regulator NifL|nr:nitrogen fixation negative regulator NifL [Zoogloeaceae bacterium]
MHSRSVLHPSVPDEAPDTLSVSSPHHHALLAAMVDEAPVALALIDHAGQALLDNREYKKLVADLGARDLARRILDMALPDWRTAIRTPAFQGFRARELRIERPGAAALRWFSCSLRPLDIRTGDACLLLAVDDTTSLRREQENARLAILRAHLLEEEHADVLRESLSAALYQLEGPLNVMRSAIHLLKHPDSAVSGVLASALADGRAHLEALRRLIPLEPREAFTLVNLNEVLHDVLNVATQDMLRNGVTVNWQPDALPAILGRPMQLHALFKALVDNAIDAVSGRGWKNRELCLSTRLSGAYVQVFVDDCGPGVPVDLRLKVFEPFFTTRTNQGQHLGTGLSRALEVACEHGGTLALADAPCGGCRAFVELPVEQGERQEELDA